MTKIIELRSSLDTTRVTPPLTNTSIRSSKPETITRKLYDERGIVFALSKLFDFAIIPPAMPPHYIF
jgi:hypothetical protein